MGIQMINEQVKSIIQQAKQEKRWLLEPEAMQILKAYKISVPEYCFTNSLEDTLKGADSIGYPVVLKIVSPDILHKSDADCVKLNLTNSDEVEKAYQDILLNARKFNSEADIKGVIVYPMVKPGLETIIGVTKDAQFGSAVMFGLGGIFVEVLKDVSFRLIPLTLDDSLEMIMETKGYKLLQGIRGNPPKDVTSLAETIVKISELCSDFPEISEIDLNPTYVYEQGIMVVDARVLVK